MKRILTAGLTPSWQHVLEFESLSLDKVNRSLNSLWFAAGKSVNAAIAIHTLGGNSIPLFPGSGPNAQKMRDDLALLGMDCQILPTKHDVRVCTTLVDRANQTVTELIEESKSLSSDELVSWIHFYSEHLSDAQAVVVSGSLPPGVTVEIYEEMVARIPPEIPAILDFRGKGLEKCLKHRPLIIKPNREELEQTVGKTLTNEQELLKACRDLNFRGAQWVVVSNGPDSLYAVNDSDVVRLAPPKVVPAPGEILCPIGCGDALTGALALAVSRGRSILDALKFAMNVATQNLRQLTSCRFNAPPTEPREN